MSRLLGTVKEIRSTREGVQEIGVLLENGDVYPAINYTDRLRCLVVGDQVLLNTTAQQLELGSGGYHFVIHLMDNSGTLDNPLVRAEGHIMKLRYTPLQHAVCSVEEEASPHHELFLQDSGLSGMPVLIGELHSMLPLALCWIQHRVRWNAYNNVRAPRIVYVMTDAAALPIAWSRHVATLKQMGWLETTITCGQAYGGQLEAVNKFSALLAAQAVAHADICIVTMGPGIVGTGTRLGHSAMEVGEWVNAVHALGGSPIVMPRISFADSRDRHLGFSHHMFTALKIAALASATIPMPSLPSPEEHAYLLNQWQNAGLETKHILCHVPQVLITDVAVATQLYPEPITSMGRGLRDDPAFFLGVCAAAETAWTLLND
ncbi:hypothetical protein D3C73_603360 [compost metagenome]